MNSFQAESQTTFLYSFRHVFPIDFTKLALYNFMNQSMDPKKDIFWTRIKMDSLKLLKGRTEKIRRIQSEQL